MAVDAKPLNGFDWTKPRSTASLNNSLAIPVIRRVVSSLHALVFLSRSLLLVLTHTRHFLASATVMFRKRFRLPKNVNSLDFARLYVPCVDGFASVRSAKYSSIHAANVKSRALRLVVDSTNSNLANLLRYFLPSAASQSAVAFSGGRPFAAWSNKCSTWSLTVSASDSRILPSQRERRRFSRSRNCKRQPSLLLSKYKVAIASTPIQLSPIN